ncbi:hypothetical protein K438DRAFT_1763873 [Mycena galopus ATCC 62051]|nr:hypothetical protein K438DRAFT_1763873 [Mycena galopus ATCC 62051]
MVRNTDREIRHLWGKTSKLDILMKYKVSIMREGDQTPPNLDLYPVQFKVWDVGALASTCAGGHGGSLYGVKNNAAELEAEASTDRMQFLIAAELQTDDLQWSSKESHQETH